MKPSTYNEISLVKRNPWNMVTSPRVLVAGDWGSASQSKCQSRLGYLGGVHGTISVGKPCLDNGIICFSIHHLHLRRVVCTVLSQCVVICTQLIDEGEDGRTDGTKEGGMDGWIQTRLSTWQQGECVFQCCCGNSDPSPSVRVVCDNGRSSFLTLKLRAIILKVVKLSNLIYLYPLWHLVNLHTFSIDFHLGDFENTSGDTYIETYIKTRSFLIS